MNIDLIQLTKELIAIPSVSDRSNVEISNLLEKWLKEAAFEVERLEYIDPNGEVKASLVAKKGKGRAGLAFISHTDTVPGQEQDWPAFSPAVDNGRLIGRGSCDMKGPLAATLVATAGVNPARLKRPVYLVITADEEVGGGGAIQVALESHLFKTYGPRYGVIAEPTELLPVYSHKGVCQITITAHGKAAHTSTDQGISANFLLAPFLVEMADLATLLKTDEAFMNQEFTPPTLGFNMTINDGGCKPNVTAAKSVCLISFRPMPDDRSDQLQAMIIEKARLYGFEVSDKLLKPFYISPEAEIVQAACQAAAVAQPQTVPFGTDAFHLQDWLGLVILGPGNIAQAHTVGEWIEIAQLEKAVTIYQQLIERFCM